MKGFALALLVLAAAEQLRSQTAFRVGPVGASPGESASGFLAVPAASDGETRIPITVICGAARGPALALVAGNHGYEYSPILASQRLIGAIDARKLKGTVIVVHVANLPSYLKRTIYYSPVDGKNLNRVYPGKRDGTLSERIAEVITREVIERADYLVDLHCGDGNESLRPYTYWMPIGDPRVDEPSRELALAFGMDRIVIDRGRPKDPAASQYCSNTAMTRGKPAITIESGGMGLAYDEEAIARIERGVTGVMRQLGMLEGQPGASQPKWLDPAEVLRFPEDLAEKSGVFFPAVAKGTTVAKGALLGRVTDYFGKKIYEARAPCAGEVLYILGTPPVSAGEPLAFIGAPR
ncbi:MAG: succinylglutamate desuccinylase [Acidobacteria bacterium]|nr:MAG: succinylglutamate desuccinylase [Acidobacteriota bacterium]